MQNYNEKIADLFFFQICELTKKHAKKREQHE